MSGLIPNPDLRTVLLALRQEILADMNCLQVGTVQTFDAAKQTATITLNSKRQFGDTVREYPLLVDVPVVVLGGGKGRITFPISSGDTCLVFFNDRNLDAWWGTGGTGSVPNTPRMHSMADGIALVGIRPLTRPITGYSTTDTQVIHDDGGLVSVAAKIEISNEDESIKDIFGDFIDDLKDAFISAGHWDSAAKSKFTAIKTRWERLFK